MKNFISLFSAELLKSKRTASFWVSICFAALFPLIFVLIGLFKPDELSEGLGKDAWNEFIGSAFKTQSTFFMPMCAIMATTMMVNLEVKNNTWKQTFALPRTFSSIFFSKFLIINLLILLYLICLPIFCYVLGNILPLVHNQFVGFKTSSPDWTKIFSRVFHSYFFLLPILSLHFWLSLRFKNVLAGIGIGLVILVTGLTLQSWGKIYLYPHVLPFLDNNPRILASIKNGTSYAIISNWLWFSIPLGLAWLDFIKRKER